MSRLDDLIDLIRTANEVYFITAPNRVRTVFILVDDIAELALKSYLQEQALARQTACLNDLRTASIVTVSKHEDKLSQYFEGRKSLDELHVDLGLGSASQKADLKTRLDSHKVPHWTVNDPDARKHFPQVISEVKDLHPAGHPILPLLDRVSERHGTRNLFFHDPNQSGLTIDDEKCLRALYDLFLLMENLFPDFRAGVQESKTVRCQIGVLRLKLEARHSSEVADPYNEALDQLQRSYRPRPEMYEHGILHTISDRFFASLSDRYTNSIAQLQTRIDQIDRMSRPRSDHLNERNDKMRMVAILSDQLTNIKSLLGT